MGKGTLCSRPACRALLLVSTVLVSAALVPLLISPVHAATNPTVFLTPSFRAQVASGSTVHYAVNVTNMPLFNGFNIFIKVDNTVLTPSSISDTGVIFASPVQDINCVNHGAGITLGNPGNLGCTAVDGPGIAHEEVACSGCFASGNGFLFNVTFTSQTSTTASSVVDVYNDQILKGTPDLVPHVTTSGFYGSTTAPADFTISASPFTQSVPRGLTGSVTITLTSVNGFAGTVTVAKTSFPAALAAVTTLNTTSVSLTAGGTKFVGATISPTSTTASGPYDLVFNATATTAIILLHEVNVGVTITVPDFSITPNPASLVNPLGSSNSSTLTLTSINQFSGVVTLSTTFFPSVANPPSILLTNSTTTASSVKVTVPAGGTVTATLTVSSTAATTVSGYTITVHGVSGTLSRTATVSASVVPFVIGVSPASLNISPGAFATSTINLASVSGVPSNVTLSSAIAPSVVSPPVIVISNSTTNSQTCACSVIVKLTAGGTNTATLNVTTISTTTINTYTVSVTGAVGTATRVAKLSVVISAAALVSVVVGADGNLYWSHFTGSWGGWQPLGGWSPQPPVLCQVSPSKVELLVTGSDDGIYVKTFSAGAWSAWVKNPAGITAMQPVCAVLGTTLYVAVVSPIGELYVTTFDTTAQTWAASWTDLSGSTASLPALVATPSLNRLDLVVRGTDNQIYHKSFTTTGGWAASWDTSNRQPVPDKTVNTPAIVSDGTNLNVVVIGSDYNLYYATLTLGTNGWSTYISLNGWTGGGLPVLTIDSAGTLHLVVQGADGVVYEKAKPSGGSWDAAWTGAGGITAVASTPAVGVIGTTLNVVQTGWDGKLWYNTFVGGAWKGWVSMTGESKPSPSVSPSP